MNTLYPVYTIVPGKTRVSEAVRQAHAAGAELWLTGRGKIILAPIGRPGWRRLNIRSAEAA
jgi:hypothetical protein